MRAAVVHQFGASLLLALLAWAPTLAQAPDPREVRWVYPERNKWPLIGGAPDSSGFFQAVFSRAAREAGLTLQVDRVPKARAWLQLERGHSDFYPGASFSPDRAQHVVWIDTGLRTREVCLVRPGLRLKTTLAKSEPLTIGVEPGSSKIDLFRQHRTQHFGSRLTVDKAVDILARERADVVVVDIEPLGAYVARVEDGTLSKLGVTVDEHCIGPWQPMYLAWSRQALPDGAKIPVLTHLSDQSASLPKNSKAARFHAAMLRLKARGELARVAVQHGIAPPP